MTAASAAVASTDPDPPPFQNSRSATRDSASEISRRRTSSCAIDACLRRRTSSDLVRWSGTSSWHAGDLPLVGHHADETEPVALDDPPCQGHDVGGVEQRGALGTDVLTAEAQSCVEVECDADLHVVGVPCCVDDVEVRRVVDHQGDRGCGSRGGEEAAQCRDVDRRVGHDDVVADAGLVQPQRLGDGEGQDAGEAVVGQGAPDERRDPQRLGRDPQRLAPRTTHEVGGVGVEHVEVHDRDRGGRRLGQGSDRLVEPRPQPVAPDEVVAHSMPRLRSSASMSARSSSTGERPAEPDEDVRGRASGVLRSARPGALPPAWARPSWRSRRKPLTTNRTTAKPCQAHARPREDVEDQPGGPVGDRSRDLHHDLQGPREPRRGRQEREAERAQPVDRAPASERDPRPDASRDGECGGQSGPRSPIHGPRVPQRATPPGQ